MLAQHHCRRCGWLVCGGCSEHTLTLSQWLDSGEPHVLRHERSTESLRVCNLCFEAESDLIQVSSRAELEQLQRNGSGRWPDGSGGRDSRAPQRGEAGNGAGLGRVSQGRQQPPPRRRPGILRGNG